MTTTPHSRVRQPASSPFKQEVEAEIEQYDCGDRVSHDLHGLGSVVALDPAGVTVNFGSKTVRVASPFRKMEKI
ncbi:hypothetical protein [Nocardioides mangrovi]|uniref:ATP-binding protein n=1 Tax=Nocardioides mangrovi TaxID=2874580 RepID=A0ABS7UGV5_9ACTN|nr:hypothetical protein [Nocardioides mangrovi]MBZ5740274.1 hypothetical protein [Nocardioides mangrovi]